MGLYYIIALSALLLLYLFYVQVSTLRWDERERRELEQIDLRLAHLLRLVEAADVRVLLSHPKTRRSLFLSLSEGLKKDVAQLLRMRALGMTSILLVGVFFVSYYLMRLKALIICGRNDLRFLLGLELAIVRTSS